MDFTSTSLRYSANYDWTSNSTAALNPTSSPELYYGNRIQNSNSIQFNGNANFVNFYNQVPFLRKANQGARPTPQSRRRGAPPKRAAPGKEGKGKDGEEEEKEKKDSRVNELTKEAKELQDENVGLSTEVEEKQAPLEEELNKVHDKRQAIVQYQAQFRQQMSQVVKDSKFYEENENCPTCSQDISNKLR